VPEDRYDVFISYAREDLEWVQQHLYEPLARCRLADGRAPRIFFDLGEHGVKGGDDFLQRIADALEGATFIVPVYSLYYFLKPMCKHELELAYSRMVLRPPETPNPIIPILQEPRALEKIPFKLQTTHFWRTTDSNWFAKLCDSLGLKPFSARPELAFAEHPAPATARLTLPPVRVRVTFAGKPRADAPEEVALAAEGAPLEGTLRALTNTEGVATFADLVVPTAATGVKLVARAAGAEPVSSAPFDVLAPPPPKVERTPPTIAAEGEAVFFASGRAVLVARPGALAVFDTTGRALVPHVGVQGRVRLVSRSGPLLAVADWSGNVWLFSDGGESRTWAFGGTAGGFVVPGAIAFDGAAAFVGFWSGRAFRIDIGGAATEAFHHDGGVQALAVTNGRAYAADFTGALVVYDLTTKRLVNSKAIEKGIWALRACAGGLVGVGDKYTYRVELQPFEVHREALPEGAAAGVFGDSDRPVLVSADGAGLRVKPHLAYGPRFRAPPGAVPVGADDAGSLCVCAAPDGTRVLVRDSVTKYSHTAGTLAVSPARDLYALGEPGGVRLLTAAAFEALFGGGL
jgi:hypothetical protein